MSTADYLDRGVKGGFEAIKAKMKHLSDSIKDLEQKEKECIAGKKDARQRNYSSFTKMSELSMQMGEKEECLRRSAEKLKYAVTRLDEKEGLVTRIKDWNDGISQVPADVLEELQINVKRVKENYLMVRQKVAENRQKIITLEDTIERRDHKHQDALKREDQLRNEYEHQFREYELKKPRCDKQLDATLDVEGKQRQMEGDYYNARRRHERAAATIVVLEAKISKGEILCEEFKKKRVAMESTLRELLSSYSKERSSAPPPKYPQSEYAVNATSN